VEGLSEEAEIQSFGLYKPRYGFATVDGYKQRLDVLRNQQKTVLKSKGAALCATTWQVGGGLLAGRCGAL
jgi:hypothetical protein